MNTIIIGAGTAGNAQAEELSSRGHNLLFYDKDQDNACALAETHGGEFAPSKEIKRTDELVDFAEDYEVDLAVVAVPTIYHFRYIKAFLPYCNVVTEKPFCLYPEEAESAVKLHEESNNNLYIAESQGYHPDTMKMAERIKSGEFGQDNGDRLPVHWRIVAMSPFISQIWSYKLEVGGGVFLEGGVHMMTVARRFFGEAVSWQGEFLNLLGDTGPDTGHLIVGYENGDILSLSIGWGSTCCHNGECQPLANQGGIIGRDMVEPFWTNDNRELMWDNLLPAIKKEKQPFISIEDAAGAVEDVWRCYESGGIYDGI